MNPNYNDNDFLIEELTKGNEEAFIYLVNTFHKKLFIYALSLTDNHAMSQDIIQNVFLRVWEYKNRLSTDYSIKNFLYKSVYNEFINQYHRNNSISKLEQAYVNALKSAIDDNNQLIIEQKIKIISKEIEKLPNKCKQTFLLSKKEGLTNIEIAEFLNISVKTVEAQITKAYSILRKATKNKLKMILFLLFGQKNATKRSIY